MTLLQAFALALSLHTPGDPTRCGAIAPGENSPLPFFEEQLAAGVAAGRYSASLPERVRPVLERLRTWETRCTRAQHRTAVHELRQLISGTRSKDELLVLRALLATALARGPDVRVQDSRGGFIIAGHRVSNAAPEARGLFEQVLRDWHEPRLAEELAVLGFAVRDPKAVRAAGETLRRLERNGQLDEGLRTYRGVIALAASDTRSAIAALPAEALTTPRGLRNAGIIRMAARHQDDVGAAQYLQGLDQATGADLELYFEDLWPLLDAAELGVYEQTPPAERSAWIRRQWEWRASLSSATAARRVQIHFQRLYHAMHAFARKSYRGAPIEEGLAYDEWNVLPFDDRGPIYVRHGEPDEIIRGIALSAAQEAWFYQHLDVPKGSGLFDFGQGPATSRYLGHLRPGTPRPDFEFIRLLECHPPMLREYNPGSAPAGGQPRRRGSRSFPTPQQQDSINRFEREYIGWNMALSQFSLTRGLIAGACERLFYRGENIAFEKQALNQRVMLENRYADMAMRSAISTEFAGPRFDHNYRGIMASYAFRGAEPQRTEVVAVLYVPAGAPTPAATEPLEYRFPVMLTVENPATRTVDRADTTLALRPPQRPGSGQAFRFALPVLATPAEHSQLRLTLRNEASDGEGQVFLSTRAIPDFSRGAHISDIVLAEPRAGSLLARGSHRMTPLPGHQVAEEAQFRMFAEVYGLTEETTARMRIVVAPIVDANLPARLREAISSRSAMELSYEEVLRPGGDGAVDIMKDIQAQLQPGRYELRLQLDLPSGTIARSTEIFVLKR